MKVLFLAKTKVFSSPVSAKVNSGPRRSNGIGNFDPLCFSSMRGMSDLGGGGDSVVVGSTVVVFRYGGRVSEIFRYLLFGL